MTVSNDTVQAPSGEARLKARRNAFLRFVLVGFVGGLLLGFIGGFAGGAFEVGDIPTWLIFAWVAAVNLGFAWFSLAYFRRVDELELADNLWASTIGLYAYFMLIGSWYFLFYLGITGEPNQYWILLATIVISFGSYIARKLGLR